jgi:hypothetical protein
VGVERLGELEKREEEKGSQVFGGKGRRIGEYRVDELPK